MELEQNREALARRGFGIAAISYDTVATLKHFAVRRNIRYPLLSDEESRVIRAFGIFNESVPEGNLARGVPHPGLFVVDASGVVTARYFEDDYRERFTVAAVLQQHFGEASDVTAFRGETEHLKLIATLSAESAAVGQRIGVELAIEMKAGMHVYAPGAPEDYIPVKWEVAESPAWKVHPADFPQPERLRLVGEVVPVFQKQFRIRRDLTVGPDSRSVTAAAPNGDLTIASTFRYQACDETKCFPPQTISMEWKVRVNAMDRERAPAEFRRPIATAKPLTFEHVIVDAEGPQDIWLKAAGDLTGDGRPDLIAGGFRTGGLVFYENPRWTKRVIAPEVQLSTDGEVRDMDADGDLDVIAVTRAGVSWFENPRWSQHHVADQELHDIEVVDLDGDGTPELVGRSQGAFRKDGGASIHLFRRGAAGEWARRRIEIPDGEGLAAADIDRDGDPDIVIERRWIENPGHGIEGEWKLHEYVPEWRHAHTFITVGDTNGDGRPDILLAPSEREGGTYRISLFEAPPDPKLGAWRERVVDPAVETVHHFAGIADFDRDGRADIATARMHQAKAPEISVYVNPGDGQTWKKVVVAATGSHSMRIVDVDGDGRPDLFGANWRGKVVEVWRNVSRREVDPGR